MHMTLSAGEPSAAASDCEGALHCAVLALRAVSPFHIALVWPYALAEGSLLLLSNCCCDAWLACHAVLDACEYQNAVFFA